MGTNNRTRILVAYGYWVCSLTLYLLAVISLFAHSQMLASDLGGVAALFICVGGLFFKTRVAARLAKDSPVKIGRFQMRLLKLARGIAWGFTLAILVGYAIAFLMSSPFLYTSMIIVPFALFFFYVGRWFILSPGVKLR